MVDPPARWLYESDEQPKRRQHWDRPRAGFVTVRGQLVGKCPAGISIPAAEALLNQGIPHRSERHRHAWPDQIWIVHDGALFRAKPTRRGVSYHAFPARGRDFQRLPGPVRTAILDRARQLGCQAELLRWLNQH